MSTNTPPPPVPPSPVAGRAAQLQAKPRSEAEEGGAKPRSLARRLRANPTLSEIRMWRLLHALRTDGYHFRRQVKLGSYDVDFACLHAKLVIEVDGSTHGTDIARHNDSLRDDYLRGRGFTVLRVFAGDILNDEAGVGEAILMAVEGRPKNHRGSPPPSPAALARDARSFATLPAGGEGGARGNIVPQTNLPARGEDEARGTIAPQTNLPATGEGQARGTTAPQTTLHATRESGARGSMAPQATLPLAGRVAKLEPKARSEAWEGGEPRSLTKTGEASS